MELLRASLSQASLLKAHGAAMVHDAHTERGVASRMDSYLAGLRRQRCGGYDALAKELQTLLT